ncbi:MAG: hypothetical protein LKI59_03850, partial [Bacteroidales bacterium]|nr:hypothetical protein [Bacteroidales bacterium]
PISNREVKPAIADGTDIPVGRVGSCRSSRPGQIDFCPGLFFMSARHLYVMCSTFLCKFVPCLRPSGTPLPVPFPEIRNRNMKTNSKSSDIITLCPLYDFQSVSA